MKSQCVFIVNCVLTAVTMMVILTTCGGCELSQIEHAQAIVDSAKPAVTAAGPALVNQPWYVFVLLAMDIASSVLAALVAYKKK